MKFSGATSDVWINTTSGSCSKLVQSQGFNLTDGSDCTGSFRYICVRPSKPKTSSSSQNDPFGAKNEKLDSSNIVGFFATFK